MKNPLENLVILSAHFYKLCEASPLWQQICCRAAEAPAAGRALGFHKS